MRDVFQNVGIDLARCQVPLIAEAGQKRFFGTPMHLAGGCLRAPEQQEVETQVEVLAERDRRLVETMVRLIDLSIQYPRCKRKPELSGQHRIPMAPDPVLRATGA